MLREARIGGSLTLTGSEVSDINADAADIKGSVFLKQGFKATGEVRLLGAQIGGDLDCSGGQFEVKEGDALSADGMNVNGSFFFRGLKGAASGVSLAAASVGQLIDDEASWGGAAVLDGFRYAAIAGGAPTSAQARLGWLDKQVPAHAGRGDSGREFRPQPWRHLQSVLREMGHAEDARQVAIAFENRLRDANQIGIAPPNWGWLRAPPYRFTARAIHRAFGMLTGYGYRPTRLLLWFVSIWLACAAFYWFVALPPQGVFAPSDPLVFQNQAYAACVPGSDEAQRELKKPPHAQPPAVRGAGNWYLCASLREEYSGFSPLTFSLDVILPLVDLHQEKSWGPLIPTPDRNVVTELFTFSWKHVTRLLIWFETLFGWVASLLLVAIVSGLAKRRDD